METDSVIGGQFDSLLAKVIVTGADRSEALQRSRRALDEMTVEGIATVLPFHRVVLRDPAFTGADGFTVHTRWIETEFDNNIEPHTGGAAPAEEEQRQRFTVEVGGRRLEVSLPASFAVSAGGPDSSGGSAKPRKRRATGGGAAPSGDAVTAPMQGTVVTVAVEDGQQVEAGEKILVLEAMKMENPVTAHKSGTVTG